MYLMFAAAKCLLMGGPFQPCVIQHPSLLGPFVSYEEKELLWIHLQESYSQHFIFIVTYEWAQEAGVFVPGKTFQPSVIQHPT